MGVVFTLFSSQDELKRFFDNWNYMQRRHSVYVLRCDGVNKSSGESGRHSTLLLDDKDYASVFIACWTKK